uniref:Kinesin motor domain-containing protein n=1 Tax=Macrostomum lignano TaxID=282301 RepID=A0A1I8FFR1_9PLAT
CDQHQHQHQHADQHQHQHQHQHAASSTAESRHRVLSPSCRRLAAAKMAKAPPPASCDSVSSGSARKGSGPPRCICHHRLEGVQAGAKAELKEVVINNQHAGFEFDMPRKQKIDQPKNQDLSLAEPRL